MDLLRKSRWQSYNAIILISLMFYMSVVTALDILPDYSGGSAVAGAPEAVRDIPIPGKNNTKAYFITNITGNEAIKELEANLTLERLSLTVRGPVLRFFKILLPFGGLAILILSILYVVRKNGQNKSILSALLGGHAPPYGFQLFCIS